MAGGIEGLAHDIADMAATQVGNWYGTLVAAGMSPIEAMFEVALVAGTRMYGFTHGRTFNIVHRSPKPGDNQVDIYLTKQVRVLDWPVDFVVECFGKDGEVHRAVVECDGHEFHERTKDQAERDRSRDRRLQAAGLRVFRFTGRELHRDSLTCMVEVISWATDVGGRAK